MAGKMAILKAPNCGCQTVRDYKNWADLQNGQIGCEIGHFGCNQTPPKATNFHPNTALQDHQVIQIHDTLLIRDYINYIATLSIT